MKVGKNDGAGSIAEDFDIVIVGAGFAGLYSLYKLREEGFRCCVLERGAGVGGVWYWNRYPGARVDVDCLEYSYSFSADLERDWKWSERYSAQPEIEAYANHVADRFDLRREIRLNTSVTASYFDAETSHWTITTDQQSTFTCKYLIMATGLLSQPKDIDIAGMETFHGAVYRTNQWPRDTVSFEGKRVGVVGTGSSGIQIIPEIAKSAKHLTVFQRTASFSMPSNNAPMDAAKARKWFENRDEMRALQRGSHLGLLMNKFGPKGALEVSEEERLQVYEDRWEQGGLSIIGSFNDLLYNREANETCAAFVRGKLRQLIDDPEVADSLIPTRDPIFTKRPCVDSGYYQTFNEPHVDLVDLHKHPIEKVTEAGIIAGSKLHELDVIVLAIGFDAMTGAMTRIDIRGRDGVSLKELWDRDGPATFMGLNVAGFPNLFMIGGPGSPSVLGNVIDQFEANADWVAEAIHYMEDHGFKSMEVLRETQDAWTQELNDAANQTLLPQVDSWWTGANIEGKKRAFSVYLGGYAHYLNTCNEIAAAGFPGFKFER